jgi:integrase
MKIPFTDSRIFKLKAKGYEYVVTDSRTPGLKCRVTAAGSKALYGYFTRDAKLVKRKLKATQVAAAREELQQLRQSAPPACKPEYLFGDLLERYAEYTSVATSQLLWRHFGQWEGKKLADVTVALVDSWRLQKASYKPSSLNRITNALKSVLNTAVRWDLLEASPLSNLRRLPEPDVSRVRYLTEAEEQSLFSALKAKPLQFQVYVTVLYYTGARPGEIRKLTWDCVREDRLQLDASKTGLRRYVPLHPKVVAALARLPRSGQWVFPGKVAGNPIADYKRVWSSLVKDAGIEDLTMYDLRHNAASQLVMKGIDLYTVSQILGHTNVQMTKRYAHLSSEHLSNAINQL